MVYIHLTKIVCWLVRNFWKWLILLAVKTQIQFIKTLVSYMVIKCSSFFVMNIQLNLYVLFFPQIPSVFNYFRFERQAGRTAISCRCPETNVIISDANCTKIIVLHMQIIFTLGLVLFPQLMVAKFIRQVLSVNIFSLCNSGYLILRLSLRNS